MAFRLQVRNYRGLRAIDWSPEGVCALVGANGSGKTTLLDVPALLGDALERGLARAFEEHGGIAHARNVYAEHSEPYEFELTVGEETWLLAPVLAEAGFRPRERLTQDGQPTVTREAGADHAQIYDKSQPVRDVLALSVAAREYGLLAIPILLERYRLYSAYDLETLRRSGSLESTERRLNRRGTNVFSVLRNWRDKREDRGRFQFVLDGLREIFSDFFDDLDFDKAAQVVGASIRLKGDRVHSASLAPDGWFVALLHLTAVASADNSDVIAIDEPENALHPHAIKQLLQLMRDWASRRAVTILLATHSPVIISDFDTRPEQLFVMQPERDVLPVSVLEVKDREWLAHFTLGDLYVREEFGAPRGDDGDGRVDHDR